MDKYTLISFELYTDTIIFNSLTASAIRPVPVALSLGEFIRAVARSGQQP